MRRRELLLVFDNLFQSEPFRRSGGDKRAKKLKGTTDLIHSISICLILVECLNMSRTRDNFLPLTLFISTILNQWIPQGHSSIFRKMQVSAYMYLIIKLQPYVAKNFCLLMTLSKHF